MGAAEQVCASLVASGADVHAGSPSAGIYHRHLDGYFAVPPLTACAQSGFPELAQMLIDAGASVDEVTESATAQVLCRSDGQQL